jgi:hypothetical protein
VSGIKYVVGHIANWRIVRHRLLRPKKALGRRPRFT